MSLAFRVPTAEQHQQLMESWLEELNFYETEIGSCELSLEQFIPSLGKSDLLASAEHFQNQYIHQREVINEIKYRIRQYMRALEQQSPGKLSTSLSRHFEHLSGDVDSFRKVFNELLLEFDDFLKLCI